MVNDLAEENKAKIKSLNVVLKTVMNTLERKGIFDKFNAQRMIDVLRKIDV